MLIRSCIVLLTTLALGFQALAAAPELDVRVLRTGATIDLDRFVDDDKVVLSVADAARNPLLGLLPGDFAIRQGAQEARIVSVQPIAESLDVPRHIVLVLDNSDSMRQRHAVEPLLAGVDELLKIIRPIDEVEIVVFDDRETVRVGGRNLHVRTFRSRNPVELKSFVAAVYREAVTARTVLYEAMFAGVERIRMMPSGEPRFLVVFSDGEDLNSAIRSADVSGATVGLERFNAYAIDYMPRSDTDRFLSDFSQMNHGQIWKATSETNLVPIFQSVASRMQYYYVVHYLFPPTGKLAVQPKAVTIDEIHSQTSAPMRFIDVDRLTFTPKVDSAYGITRWTLALANSYGTYAARSGEGSLPATIDVPLPADDLGRLAAGGSLTAALTISDRKGQALSLAVAPVDVSVLSTSGQLTLSPQALTIEEIKTLDASPMLGQIFFADGSSALPEQYVRLAAPETAASFDEQNFRDTLDKYYQVLNIVGKRLQANPEATVTLVGCNANKGVERNNKALSQARAETVAGYLQKVWGIDPARMTIEARNLPEKPSTGRLEEGRADNRRVEIRSNHPAILDLARSTYLAMRSDAKAFTLKPAIIAPRGVASWVVTVSNAAGPVAVLSGEGSPAAELSLPLPVRQLASLATGGHLTAAMQVKDGKGRELNLEANRVTVDFIQTSQRLAQKEGYLVQEKYALILFDFDSDTLDARNQAIVDAISARIRELPEARVDIVGHTDNIGKEEYNLKLSQRRAQAVHKLLSAAYGEDPGERMLYSGAGFSAPLYDNATSEGRAFNRTVTITLEYLAAE